MKRSPRCGTIFIKYKSFFLKFQTLLQEFRWPFHKIFNCLFNLAIFLLNGEKTIEPFQITKLVNNLFFFKEYRFIFSNALVLLKIKLFMLGEFKCDPQLYPINSEYLKF